MRRTLGWTSALAMLALFVVGCGDPASPQESTTTSGSNLGGDGLPVQIADEDYGHHARPLTGRLGLEPNGCWTLDLGDGPRIVILPEGFTKSEDGAAMLASDGAAFTDALEVDVMGGIVASQTLPGGTGGFWANYLAFCDPERGEVVVVDSIEPAFEPTELIEEDLLELLQTESLSRSWGCGFGFTATSENQRVAVQLYPVEMQPTPGPVTFPDDGWVGEVLVGKHLAANNCDDVVEGWEPEAVIATRWPLSGGTLSFDIPSETDCGLAGAVTAILEDGSIETSSGTRSLPELSIVNESYGCFAG